MCHSAKASSAMGLDEEVGKVNLQRTEEGNRFHHQTGWKLRHWISEPGLSTRGSEAGQPEAGLIPERGPSHWVDMVKRALDPDPQ
jgi:hypothetical protein